MTATMNRAVANRKKNNKGFSLVELIIVIAIMAILTALLAPQFLKYVERSRVARDISNIALAERSIQVALADEDVYKDVAIASGDVTVTYAADGTLTSTDAELLTELRATLGVTATTKLPAFVSAAQKSDPVIFTITFSTHATTKNVTISIKNDAKVGK